MLDALPVRRFDLLWSATGGARRDDGAFAENLWRGALGHALRRNACLTGASACAGCTQTAACLYSYIFETPPPADAQVMRLYPHAPHPYVLRVVPGTVDDTQVRLRLVLIGDRAAQALPLVVLALREAAAGPHGIGGQRFELHAVLQEPVLGAGQAWTPIDTPADGLLPLAWQPPELPACPTDGDIRIALESPLKVKREGRPVTAERSLAFGDFYGALQRRVSMLMAFHGRERLSADFAGLAAQSRALAWTDAQAVPASRTRYSNRQRAPMRLDALMGRFSLAAVDAAAFWPTLWLGQFIHNGGATAMGFGAYRIELPPPAPLARAEGLPAGGDAPASLPARPAAPAAGNMPA